jgi:tetratricopeptide (TPR) repeat protein
LNSIVSQLQQIQSLIQQRKIDDALSTLSTLIQKYPDHPDVLQLLAMSYKAKGDFHSAKKYLLKLIELFPDNSAFYNTLANCYVDLNDYQRAETMYLKALKLNENALNIYQNLALFYLETDKPERAISLLKNVINKYPQEIKLLTLLADAYRKAHVFDKAIQFYQQALKINPNYVKALHNLGLTYKLTEQLDYAAACLQQAHKLSPTTAETAYNLANTYFEQNNYNAAEKWYWYALQLKPTDIDVHLTLNEFYWQLNHKDKFGQSFEQAIKQFPAHMALRQHYVELLLNANLLEKAHEQLSLVDQTTTNYYLVYLAAKLAAKEKAFTQAITLFRQSLAIQFEQKIALDFIELLLFTEHYDEASVFINKLEKEIPFNQLLIAYKGLLWQLMGDERVHWLLDYEQFVGVYDLPTPKGYRNLKHFLEELSPVLLEMHQLKFEPLKQTLKHGTQTPGRLFYKPYPVITHLRKAFEQVTLEFIDSLPDDKTHPLLVRKSRNLDFSGSWSVKLKPQGFHVNHVHPQGWLSSCFYVNVPDFSTFPQQNIHAGAIKFGESPLHLGAKEKIGRIVQPTPGLVALFPSYMWHGTIPFDGGIDDFRLTAPCDIVPVGFKNE